MRILFMGTPDFAVVTLKRLVEDGHEICGVFTQPDKPKNRGHKLLPTPVKAYALTQGIPVYQPVKLRDGTALALVQELKPELIVVVAYGRILPKELLEAAPYGAVNVHASLLPKYRGAAPINWAMLNDEPETGVSIMYMAEELDAGDVIRVAKTPIAPEEPLETLWNRLAELGAQALSETIPTLADGTATRTVQDSSQATYAPMLSKDLSLVDWTRPARAVDCQIRGLQPWPCAVTDVIDGNPIKLFAAEVLPEKTDKLPGVIVAAGKTGIDIACGGGTVLRILELQAQGGKRMASSAYLLGHPISR